MGDGSKVTKPSMKTEWSLSNLITHFEDLLNSGLVVVASKEARALTEE